MEIKGMDIVVLMAAVIFIVALLFVIYFRIQEKHKKGGH